MRIGGRLVLALLLALPAASAGAQSSCGGTPGAAAGQHWSAPLDRIVSINARDVSLRDALDRLAAAARIRLSYATEHLPLDRRTCLVREGIAAGAALAELLRGTAVTPVAAGNDQVVLAPAQPADTAARSMARTVGVLERVVVTGSTIGVPQRPLTVALDVLDGQRLRQEHRGAGTFSQMLDGAVPGLWMWEQSPTSLLARYGSIRGASSFGVSYPKIYIDGIEVANPLLVTRFTADAIERIEVIRGPQGAALYGADAISGVVNIITRRDGGGAGAPTAQLRTEAGVAESDFAARGAFAQHHTLSLRAGSSTRTGGLGVTVGTLGEFIPGAFSRELSATGGARFVGARSTISLTGRFFAERAGSPSSPLMSSFIPSRSSHQRRPGPELAHATDAQIVGDTFPAAFGGDTAGPQSVRQYTLGATASVVADDRWTRTVVVGLDGYRLTNASDDGTPFPSATDSALVAARGGADRGTMRVSAVGQFGEREGTSGTLTFSAEHSTMRQQMTVPAWADPMTQKGPPPGGSTGSSGTWPETVATGWRSNTGFTAQGSLALRDAAFVTGGLRLEHAGTIDGASKLAMLPMLGAAVVRDYANATLKVRGAYGRGIRAPSLPVRDATWMGAYGRALPSDLDAESQSGIELGADLFVGRRLAVHATRFDQLASGLIQPVAIAVEGGYGSTGPGGGTSGRRARRFAYELQNVGEIENTGWELEAHSTVGRLTLGGTLSLTESRVRPLSNIYSGDLRRGDRMLEVPARTASLSAAWSAQRWHASLGLSRASDWINYDRLALADSLSRSTIEAADFVGADLRKYWIRYDGVNRLRASFSREVTRGLTFVLTGENLLGAQQGEPDNVTVLPGRTLTAGLKARF